MKPKVRPMAGEPNVVRSVLVVLRDLMQGGRHSRHTTAARGGVSLVTADRWMRCLLEIPGCKLVKVGKTTWIEYAAAQAPGQVKR